MTNSYGNCLKARIESYIVFTKIVSMWWLWFTVPGGCQRGCEIVSEPLSWAINLTKTEILGTA